MAHREYGLQLVRRRLATRGLGGAILAALMLMAATTTAQSIDEAAAARIMAAERAYVHMLASFEQGEVVVDDLYIWSVRWLQAQRDANPDEAETALREHLSRLVWLEQQVNQRVAAGTLDEAATARVAYYVAEAMYWLVAAGFTP